MTDTDNEQWVTYTSTKVAPKVSVLPCRLVPRHYWAVCLKCREREIWRSKAHAQKWAKDHVCGQR